MAEQTCLSFMTLHDDGTATSRVWKIPAEAAADLGAADVSWLATPQAHAALCDVMASTPGVVTHARRS